MKTLISLAVALCLIGLPFTTSAQTAPPPDPQPQNFVMGLCGVLVLIAGTVVVIELWKVCKKLPPMENPDPDTNAPPPPTVQPGWTNITVWPGTNNFTITCTDADLRYHAIVNYLPPDTNSGPAAPWLYYSAVDFLTSDNLRDWTCSLTYTQWISPLGSEWVFATNGRAFLTNYSPAANGSYTNVMPVPLALPPGANQRFFRLQSH